MVVKVGSSSLTTAAGGLDPARLDALVDAIAGRVAAGSQVVLVSSGAIAAGLAPLGLRAPARGTWRPSRPRPPSASSCWPSGTPSPSPGTGSRVGQVLLTSDDVVRRAHYRNAQHTFGKLLSFGVVPVVNENDTVATAEIRFGDNDRLAALVAHLVGAGALILLSDVDALYTGDPRLTRHPGRSARCSMPARWPAIGIARAGSDVGTGGMESKLTSALTATGAGIPVLLASAADAVAALAVLDRIRRMRPARTARRHRLRAGHPADQRPVVLASARRDGVRLDQSGRRRGGGRACNRRKSLLPAGITALLR